MCLRGVDNMKDPSKPGGAYNAMLDAMAVKLAKDDRRDEKAIAAAREATKTDHVPVRPPQAVARAGQARAGSTEAPSRRDPEHDGAGRRAGR